MKKYLPLICTNNTQGHVDYGIPISGNKSTDYRTAYGVYHRFIPNKAQEFDCRAEVRLLKEQMKPDWNIKEVNYNTNYNSEYYAKQASKDPNSIAPNILHLENTHHLRTEQERYFKNPVPPIYPKLSDMKENYQGYIITPEYKEVFPPEPNAKGKTKGMGRTITPQSKGYYKWLDPYLTTSRAAFVDFLQQDRFGIGDKDIITFYVGKGYTPVNAPPTEPIVPKKGDPIYDKAIFTKRVANNIVRKQVPKIPNFGMGSTYQGDYIKQSFSDLYTLESGQEFGDSLSEDCPWQTLCPPAMYCTEYCHIGTGWPLCSVIEEKTKNEIVHDRCFTKFCDWSQ